MRSCRASQPATATASATATSRSAGTCVGIFHMEQILDMAPGIKKRKKNGANKKVKLMGFIWYLLNPDKSTTSFQFAAVPIYLCVFEEVATCISGNVFVWNDPGIFRAILLFYRDSLCIRIYVTYFSVNWNMLQVPQFKKFIKKIKFINYLSIWLNLNGIVKSTFQIRLYYIVTI